MRKILLVDICGTLYKENTTFVLLESMFPNELEFRKKILVKIINKLLLIIIGFDLVKYISIRKLKGFSKNELEIIAKKLIDTEFSLNDNVLNFIECKKQQDFEIIFLSATIDPIASMIASKYDAKFISSTLDYENEICTGKIRKDILLSKEREVNFADGMYFMITDNRTDLRVCTLCDEFYGVASNSKDLEFWARKGAKDVFNI